MRTGGYVYILASKRNGTLYTGVTNDIVVRVSQHRSGVHERSFTRKYDVKRLVYYEHHADFRAAIHREKQIKRWRRKWKLELIESVNPAWRDLYLDFRNQPSTSGRAM